MKHICRYLQTLLRDPSFASPLLSMASRINTEGPGLAKFGLGYVGSLGRHKGQLAAILRGVLVVTECRGWGRLAGACAGWHASQVLRS
jgi:hypothetical protein